MKREMKVSGVFDRLRRKARTLAAVFLIACLPLVKGCYGSFPLTKWVYELNGKVTDLKIVHELVFLVFVIVPVYSIAMLGDAVIFNLVEFWTGATPDSSESMLDDGTHVALAPGATPDEAILTMSHPDGTTQVVRFVRSPDKHITIYEGGTEVVGYVIPEADGSFTIQDAEGKTVNVLTPALLSALQLRAEQAKTAN